MASDKPRFRKPALRVDRSGRDTIANIDTVKSAALPKLEQEQAESSAVPIVQSAETTTETPDLSTIETIAMPALSSVAAPPEDTPAEDAPTQTFQASPIPPTRPWIKRWPAIVLFVVLLIGLLVPGLTLLTEGISAYSMYMHAYGGVQHLLHVKTVFTGVRAHPTGFLDVNKLHTAQQEFRGAHSDFQQLSVMLNQDRAIGIATTLYPRQVQSVRALSKIGIDVAESGEELVKTALVLAPTFRGPLLNDSKKPLVTPQMFELVRTTIKYLLPRLSEIQQLSRSLSFDGLPVSNDQRQQFTLLVQAIPQAQADLIQAYNLLDAFAWVLGVNEPRTLLVQTMDRAELRPTGGFTGQFGELQISGGRLAPFTLKDIGPYEENNPEGLNVGQFAPSAYRSWWPIPNWGLRDSNLSADFPTSARIAIDTYRYEFGHQVDGIVLFSPFLIAHVLQMTGPISLPAYGEKITAQNLEERLHYYQLDNSGIRKEELVEHVEDPGQARKLFTASLARTLMDHVRHAPPDELIAIAREMLHDLKTRDLQVYVTNPQVEALLIQQGMAAQIDRSLTHDGLFVVQANISASKASQYVQTILHDVVTLDAKGGATHMLQIRLVYNQLGSVYGLDTYRDYIRIYVPPTSQFLWGDGFDSGKPFCGGPYAGCPRYDIYGNGDLLCPAATATSGAGAATGMLNDPYMGKYHPLDQVGPPTNMTSDESQRGMFGGWVIVPKNCTMTVSLSWYVPPMGKGVYSLLVQRQASTFPLLDLTVLPTPRTCSTLKTAGFHVQTVMSGQDQLFTLPTSSSGRQTNTACSPAMRV
jgi:hypothetical protein